MFPFHRPSKNLSNFCLSLPSNSTATTYARLNSCAQLSAERQLVLWGQAMSIFAQAFPVHGGDEGEESSSVFGPAPVRMRLDKPAANRFILGAVRRAQGTRPPLSLSLCGHSTRGTKVHLILLTYF
jgi:hypothetical protein